MQRKATKAEAQRLVDEFGPAAYEKALAAARAARRKQNNRLSKFLAQVARRIAIDAARDNGPSSK
jgi:hypothetical protein